MKTNTLGRASNLCGKRPLGVAARKRAVQYWLLGLKDEKRLLQQYGLSVNLLWGLRRWYWRHFEAPHFSSPSKPVSMRSREKALQERIRKLEKEKKELEKALEWERVRSQAFETMIDVTEEELGLPIRKIPIAIGRAGQSGK